MIVTHSPPSGADSSLNVHKLGDISLMTKRLVIFLSLIFSEPINVQVSPTTVPCEYCAPPAPLKSLFVYTFSSALYPMTESSVELPIAPVHSARETTKQPPGSHSSWTFPIIFPAGPEPVLNSNSVVQLPTQYSSLFSSGDGLGTGGFCAAAAVITITARIATVDSSFIGFFLREAPRNMKWSPAYPAHRKASVPEGRREQAKRRSRVRVPLCPER